MFVDGLEDRRGFYVEDDGPRIPAADRDQVFDRTSSTSDAGNGFGLAIVQRIVQAPEWTITVDEGSGGNGRFEIVAEPESPPGTS